MKTRTSSNTRFDMKTTLDKLIYFLNDMVDPEVYGFAVTDEVRREAAELLQELLVLRDSEKSREWRRAHFP